LASRAGAAESTSLAEISRAPLDWIRFVENERDLDLIVLGKVGALFAFMNNGLRLDGL